MSDRRLLLSQNNRDIEDFYEQSVELIESINSLQNLLTQYMANLYIAAPALPAAADLAATTLAPHANLNNARMLAMVTATDSETENLPAVNPNNDELDIVFDMNFLNINQEEADYIEPTPMEYFPEGLVKFCGPNPGEIEMVSMEVQVINGSSYYEKVGCQPTANGKRRKLSRMVKLF